ncbi:MAG: TolC family protein [Proteobacteria bacterium]|nr:TolC family protein [Pseudomonadota bacterium]
MKKTFLFYIIFSFLFSLNLSAADKVPTDKPVKTDKSVKKPAKKTQEKKKEKEEVKTEEIKVEETNKEERDDNDAIKINLNAAIIRVLNYNGEVLAERKDIDFGQGVVDRARAGWFPKGTLYLLAAPIFQEKGNAIKSVKDYGKWGVFTDAVLQVVQPLYTFGMLSDYRDAAQHGFDVETQKVRTKEEDIVYRLKQFYYGYQLANDLVDILQEAKDKLDDSVKTAERLMVQDKIKREDLFTIKTYYAQMLSKYEDARRGKYLAQKALSWVLGYKLDTKVVPEDGYLNPEEVELKPETDYLVSVMDNRPEIKMLHSGIEATRSLWQAQTKQKRPMVFLMGNLSTAFTNVRDRQYSSFANDPYNGLSGALLFGIKFDLDWWSINAMSKQAKAEYEKLLTEKETLEEGMMLQVKKAYREAVDYKKEIEYTKYGEDNASKWIVNTMMGYSLGITQAKDLMESMKTYFESKVNYCLAMYNYNMALADLTRNTGKEVVPSIKY